MNPAEPLQTTAPSAELPREQAEQLIHLQKDILEAVALGHDRETILDDICRSAETMLPESVGSIMLYDESRTHLVVRSAPNVPEAAIQQLNGLVPGECSGSCGTAVYQDKPVFVKNTLTDHRWADFHQYAIDFDIGACWSMPIRTEGGEIIGSFALSIFRECEPDAFHKHLLETSAALASIVIRRQQEETLLHAAAYQDTLTGLPNRYLFMQQLDHAIESARRNDTQLALLFIDLDQFKNINDTQGHETGDRILQTVASTMARRVRKMDLLARFGGDEFVILLEDIGDTEEVSHVTAKLIDAFNTPITIRQRDYSLTTSIGISLFPRDAGDRDTLLRRADTAMYEAKKRGRNQCFFYQAELGTRVDQHVAMEAALRQAITQRQFILHYQPIYRADDGGLDSVEALVRWQRPGFGTVAPDDFIWLAEDTGLIKPIGEQILFDACRQCSEWWQSGLPHFQLAVNISARQLDGLFFDQVQQVLARTGFPAGQLEIEVTESTLMDPRGEAVEELLRLRELGIGVAMDDFGTGHSSLAQLKHLPISKLKIDRSFVRDIPEDPSDAIIARTIIAMGNSLGLKVVAEGVESRAQEAFLKAEHCDLLQGYLFDRPMSASELEILLARSAD